MGKVLITGGNSYVGKYISRILRKESYELVNVQRSRRETDLEHRDGKFEQYIYGDICDKSLWNSAPSDINVVVHLASICREHNKSKIKELLNTNILGTLNVFEYANRIGANKVIFASSVSIYGRPNVFVVDENTPTKDPDLYGLSKLVGETILREQLSERPTVAIRLPAILGREAHSAWIPRITERILMGQDVTIYNPDFKINNFVSVNDVARFTAQLVNLDFVGHHQFPLGCEGKMSVLSIVEYIKQVLKSNSKIEVASASSGSFMLDDRYAREHFGYAPTNIENTLLDYLGQYI